MAHVLVTGGAGFIGSHTVDYLLRQGHTVTALDNLASGSWSHFGGVSGPLTRVTADVRDVSGLRSLVQRQRFDAIIHLAAEASVPGSVEAPDYTFAVNVGGTQHVLEVARTAGIPRVVLASSSAVYSDEPPLPTAEDCALQPVSPYAAHKAAAEMLCQAYRASYGIETVILRYFNVYGARQPADSPYSGVIAVFAHRLSAGLPLLIDGDGEQTRDFIHVSDVAAINTLAAVGPDPGGEPVNIGRGEQVSILALLATIRAALGVDATVRFGPERAGDVRHSRADISRLIERFGYRPVTALPAGIRAVLDDDRPSQRSRRPDAVPA